MIYEEEEQDNEAAHKEKVKMMDTKNKHKKQETIKMSADQDETKNKKEKQANGLTTKAGKHERMQKHNMPSKTTVLDKEEVINNGTKEASEDNQKETEDGRGIAKT